MKKVTLLATLVLALAMSASAQKMIDFTHLAPATTPAVIPDGYDYPIEGFRWDGIEYVSVPLYEEWLKSHKPPLAKADGMETGPEAQVALIGGPLCYAEHGGTTSKDVCRGSITIDGPDAYFRPNFVYASEGWSGDGDQYVTVSAYLNGKLIGQREYDLGVEAQRLQLVMPNEWGAVTELAFWPSPGGSVVLYVLELK